MIWNGKTISDMSTLIDGLSSCKTKQEANQFFCLYREDCQTEAIARHNIGYVAGYMNIKDGDRVMRLFDCPHPFFGFEHPTAEDALNLGKKMAELSKIHGSAAAIEMLTHQDARRENPWNVGLNNLIKPFN